MSLSGGGSTLGSGPRLEAPLGGPASGSAGGAPLPTGPAVVPPSPFLRRQGAIELDGPDPRIASHYGSPVREQRALDEGLSLVDLSDRGVIAVTGPARLTWLHSFASQDFLHLEPGASTESLWLSPTGRIEHQAAVLVVDDAVLLVTEPARTWPLLEFLGSMRFTARVDLADVSDQWAALGSTTALTDVPGVLDVLAARAPREAGGTGSGTGADTGTDADAAPGDAPAILATWIDPWPEVSPGGAEYTTGALPLEQDDWSWRIALVRRDLLRPLAASASVKAGGALAYDALRIAARRPRAGSDTDERSIPHELDWLRTAVHVDKGCYRGQETIAKVMNLGQPPRRLVFLELDGSLEAQVKHGDPVMLGTRQAGVVTSWAYHMDLGPIALALVKRATPLDAELTVRAVAGVDPSATGREASEPVLVDVAALQEPIVVTREHGARPTLGRLGTRDQGGSRG